MAEREANVRVPRYHQLMWPVVKALKDLGGSASNEEIRERVAENEGLSEVQQNVLHLDGPRTRLDYNLAWAKTYLRNGDAVENSRRGVWALTDMGQSLTEDDVKELHRHVQEEFTARRRSDARSGSAEAEDEETDEAEASWKTALLNTLYDISPNGFERLCQQLLREAGFKRVEVRGRSGDGGIDGVGTLRVALISFRVFFQCKRYRGSVGASAIRDFRGAMMGRGDKGIFVTTGNFTAEAHEEASRVGAADIDLIDGDLLCDLLKQYELGVRTQQVEEVEVKTDWFERFR